MKKIMKAVVMAATSAVAILGAIMAIEWLTLAFVAPLTGLKFCILYLLA